MVKTNEGCLADFIIKPVNFLGNKWLMVQLKVTTKAQFGQYCFTIGGKNYDKCVMALTCLDEAKTWVLDGTMASTKSNLNIGMQKSKYDQFSVSTDICQVFRQFYNDKELFGKSQCMVPISKCQQQEQVYRSLIHNELQFLKMVLPESEGLKHDFLINEFKVQEKVCSVSTRQNGTKCYTASLYNNNGKVQGKRIYKRYKLGENDFYWIWIKGQRCFFVIPENPLFDNDLLDDENTTSKKKTLCLQWKSKTEWYSKYFYDLDNLDVEKLSHVFNC